MSLARTLPSEMTIYTVGELHRQCLEWLNAPSEAAASASPCEDTLVVEAGAVAEVDAAGVQLLLSLDRSLQGEHLSLLLHEPSPALSAACLAMGAQHLLATHH